jgi:hypothetical protein
MISQCSSTFTVGDSPVVPTTPMQSVPSAMCQSISLRSGVVHAAVFVHGGDEGDDAAGEGAVEEVMSAVKTVKGHSNYGSGQRQAQRPAGRRGSRTAAMRCTKRAGASRKPSS